MNLSLSHLDKRNTYARMLFIDYSSGFNTIVLSKLIIKLGALGSARLEVQDPVTQGGVQTQLVVLEV